jgi:hypothetical protein
MSGSKLSINKPKTPSDSPPLDKLSESPSPKSPTDEAYEEYIKKMGLPDTREPGFHFYTEEGYQKYLKKKGLNDAREPGLHYYTAVPQNHPSNSGDRQEMPAKNEEKQSEKMMVLRSYHEAFEAGKPYLPEEISESDKLVDVPKEASSKIWKMTEEALGNTLHYIFNKLHHNCKMFCVKDNKAILYKLENNTTAPTFKRAIDESISQLDKNTQIDESQRKYIKAFVAEPVRVMQCIVKKYKSNDELTQNEYIDLFKEMNLPNGVFILNLTDALILRKDGEEPFQMVTGKKMMEPEFQFTSHIPILSMSGQKGYHDIPIPNYDDLLFILGRRNDLNSSIFIADWASKTIEKAVFRGGSTGCGYTVETNMRMKLANMESPLIDAAITSKGKTIKTRSIKFDPKYGIGMINSEIKAAPKFLSMVEQSQYKYIIHVDGNVNAYRLLTTMLTGSLILRVMSEYTSWVDHLLKPNVHYIPIRPDLSDLVAKIEWCKSHDLKASKIANAGYEFARNVLTRGYIRDAIENIFWTVSHQPKPKRAALPAVSMPSESSSESSLSFSPKSPKEKMLSEKTQEELNKQIIKASKTKDDDFTELRRLIEEGADVDAMDEKRNTPLMHAIYNERLRVVKALIDAGANIKHSNEDGMTPEILAKSLGYKLVKIGKPKSPVMKSPMVEAKSPMVEAKSPMVEAKSPMVEAKSPMVEEAKSPVGTSSKSKSSSSKNKSSKSSSSLSSSSKPTIIDYPEEKKRCPKGYVVFTDKADGKKKCKRKTEKKKK